MELKEALEQANVIITEEEKRPSLQYILAKGGPTERANAHSIFVQSRKQRPRTVLSDPEIWEFRSPNYDALVILLSQIDEPSRGLFLGGLLNKTRTRAIDAKVSQQYVFPMWASRLSALPLIMEVCIRNGHIQLFLKVLGNVDVPTAALAVMMVQLEETLSVNFNVFSQQDLKDMPATFRHLLEVTRQHTKPQAGKRAPHFIEARAIEEAVVGFLTQCQQAQYWYVLGALQRKPNLEIESDKKKVENFLKKLGFSDIMVELLNVAEKEYRDATTTFELKNALSHLRTFLEHLHRSAAKTLAQNAGTTIIDRWGDATLYLRTSGLLTKQHESFAASIYTLISDESVHPLGTAPEYARLLRNVVIEYGVMFLSVLDKNGISITPESLVDRRA